MAAISRRSRLVPLKPTVPDAFVVYIAFVAALAVASLLALPWVRDWQVEDPALLVVLSAFVLAGEFLPIPVPRRRGLANVTISAAFAFAILLRFGPGPAALIYVSSSVIADAMQGVSPLKILFNAAQYLLAIVAAGGVLLIAHSLPLGPITGSELPIVLAAAAALFVTNHVLACAAGTLLARLPVAGYLRDDLAFQAWTAGCVLAFAPALRVRRREHRAGAGVLRADAGGLLRRSAGRAVEPSCPPRCADRPPESLGAVRDAPGAAGRGRTRAACARGDAARSR